MAGRALSETEKVSEFLAWFRTDEDCMDYLEWLRWPSGFACPHCGQAGGRLECGGCGRRTSATAGTIFDRTRTPLTVWFHACLLFATAKDGISARHLQIRGTARIFSMFGAGWKSSPSAKAQCRCPRPGGDVPCSRPVSGPGQG